MNRFGILGMAALLGMAIASSSAAQKTPDKAAPAEAPPAKRNIILITVDSLRADRLDPYVGKSDLTPEIGKLAMRGVWFDRAYTASVSTAPANASIITGLYPQRHHLRHDMGGHLGDDVTTLAEMLQGAGYTTAAVVGSFHLDSDRGLDRGFDIYDDAIEGLVRIVLGRSMERSADQVVAAGLGVLDGVPPGKPFFLWINFYDPHYDYFPPQQIRDQFEGRDYDGEVAYLDRQIGAFLKGLRARKLFRNTHIILTGTHGEGLEEHGETGHGVYLFETTIRVPLLIAPAGPGMSRGTAINTAVSLVDVAPTVLDLAGAEAPSQLDGEPLTPFLRAGGRVGADMKSGERKLFVEAVQPHQAYGWSPLYAVLMGDRKVVQGRWVEAFDLSSDPGEAAPIEKIPSWARELAAFGRPLLGTLVPSESERQAILKEAIALELPWDNSPICLERQDWPDPRDADRLSLNGDLFKARIDFYQKLTGRAAMLAGNVLKSDPVNYTALQISLFLNMRNRWSSMMMEPLELFQCNYPYRGEPYHYYAHHLEQSGASEKALKVLRLFSRLEPWNEEGEYDLAAVYASMDEKHKALEHLKRAIALGSRDFASLWRDPRFGPLMDDPRFVELVGPAPSPR